MSKVYTDPSNYSNIAAAIREKVGGSTQYKPNQMADAIRAIETEPVIEPLSVTENGQYIAPSGVDGYSPISVNVSGGTARLPSAYQEVEYISGTGTQWIDTQTLVPAGAKFEFEIYNSYAAAWGGYFGTTNTSGFRLICSSSSSNAYLQYNGSSGGSFSFPMEKRDTYHLTDSALYNSVGATYTTHPAFQTNEHSLLIWITRIGTGLDVIGCFRLYRFLMYSSAGTTLLNLVPCYRKADGVIGLFDLVSYSFLTNSGTGTFLKGPNISYSLEELTATENGVYTPSEGYLGFSKATVNVSGGAPSGSIHITQNGTYDVSSKASAVVEVESQQVQVLTSNKAAVVDEDAELAETVAITNHGVIDDPTWSIEAVEGAGYGFALNDAGYYESQNKNVHSSAALCKIVFNTHDSNSLLGRKLYLDCINSGETNYDFGLLSVLNTTLSTGYGVDSTGVFKNFKGQSSTSVVTVNYGPIAEGDNFIIAKFRKDSSASSGNDSLQFKVRIAI